MVKIDRADRLFSLYIRTRDSWQCQRCGKQYTPPTNALHCSHFKGRAKEATRFEPLNADAICYGCHVYLGSHPDEHLAWQIQRKGQAVVDKIILQASTYKRKDRKKEAAYWKQRLKDEFEPH